MGRPHWPVRVYCAITATQERAVNRALVAGAAIASLLAGLPAMSVCVRKTRLTNKKKKSVYLSFVSLHISSIFGGRKDKKKSLIKLLDLQQSKQTEA